MDKNTLLAIVLSVIILGAGFFVQQTFFMPPAEQAELNQAQKIPSAEVSSSETSTVTETSTPSGPSGSVAPTMGIRANPEEDTPSSRNVQIETDLFTLVFSTQGALLKSVRLKEHFDTETGKPVEMVFDPENQRGAFGIAFGGPAEQVRNDVYDFEKIDADTYEFSRQYQVMTQEGEWSAPFTVRKVFHFEPGHYLFRISVAIENSVNEYLPLNKQGYAYTLKFGPQLGPSFEKLDGRYSYRKFYAYIDGKKKEIKPKGSIVTRDESMLSWGAVTGKYFSVIAKPEYSPSVISWDDRGYGDLTKGGNLYLTRPEIRATKNTDLYEVYIGPKLKENLAQYNDPAKNPYNLSQMNFDSLAEGNGILRWLEAILKFFLEFFYKLIPNYGVAIILLTLLVKVLLFPLTHKSYESTSKMQTISPKMTELREKYKDNPEKLNKATAELYKKEGINPLGGCLPLLLQFPILISLFWVFMKHFDLRGAVFISGWITDLSAPESIFNFAPLSLPFIGSDLRLLPILMVGTQILTTKVTQSNAAQSNGQMKFMTYGLPVIFFFILYNMPSGLLVYWTISNLLTLLQQMYFNKRKQEKA